MIIHLILKLLVLPIYVYKWNAINMIFLKHKEHNNQEKETQKEISTGNDK